MPQQKPNIVVAYFAESCRSK